MPDKGKAFKEWAERCGPLPDSLLAMSGKFEDDVKILKCEDVKFTECVITTKPWQYLFVDEYGQSQIRFILGIYTPKNQTNYVLDISSNEFDNIQKLLRTEKQKSQEVGRKELMQNLLCSIKNGTFVELMYKDLEDLTSKSSIDIEEIYRSYFEEMSLEIFGIPYETEIKLKPSVRSFT